MFTRRELATLVAALRFWRDEMTPHEPEGMESYFEGLAAKPLSADAIEALCERLIDQFKAVDPDA